MNRTPFDNQQSARLTRRQARPRAGLTLVEVTVSSLLVGLVLVAGLKATGAVIQARASVANKLDGIGLAHELMTEILTLPYEDPVEDPPILGLDTGEGLVANLRGDFDDIDDYDSWSATPPRHKDSASPRTEYNGWQRDVTVEYMNPDLPTSTSLTDKDLKRITVTVTDPAAATFTLRAFRSRWGVLEQDPSEDLTAITWAGVELEIGTGTGKVLHGTNLPNHAKDN